MTEPRTAISRFLQSQLGLLLITSVMVPLVTFSYRGWRDHVAAETKAAIETRIIVYRMDIITYTLDQTTYPYVCRAYAALQGDTDCYKPLYPELETNIPLSGLIYRALPGGSLIGDELPEPVDTLTKIAGALLPVVGPGATEDGFTAAYREQADTIKALRTRLLGQYPQLKAELKLSRR